MSTPPGACLSPTPTIRSCTNTRGRWEFDARLRHRRSARYCPFCPFCPFCPVLCCGHRTRYVTEHPEAGGCDVVGGPLLEVAGPLLEVAERTFQSRRVRLVLVQQHPPVPANLPRHRGHEQHPGLCFHLEHEWLFGGRWFAGRLLGFMKAPQHACDYPGFPRSRCSQLRCLRDASFRPGSPRSKCSGAAGHLSREALPGSPRSRCSARKPILAAARETS